MQDLDIVVWFLSSWQQIMLILVFLVKPPSQNDVFWGYRPQIPSVQLKIMVFICPKQYYKQKHIKINEKILRETWCLWGTSTWPLSGKKHMAFKKPTGHARAVMHVRISKPRWRVKRSRYSWRMRNPQFYVARGPYCHSQGNERLFQIINMDCENVLVNSKVDTVDNTILLYELDW